MATISRKGERVLFRRQAPEGYVAVSRPLAKRLFEKGVLVTIAGSNVAVSHIFSGWALGCPLISDSFDERVDEFISNLEPKLGRYASFYVEKQRVAQYLEMSNRRS